MHFRATFLKNKSIFNKILLMVFNSFSLKNHIPIDSNTLLTFCIILKNIIQISEFIEKFKFNNCVTSNHKIHEFLIVKIGLK